MCQGPNGDTTYFEESRTAIDMICQRKVCISLLCFSWYLSAVFVYCYIITFPNCLLNSAVSINVLHISCAYQAVVLSAVFEEFRPKLTMGLMVCTFPHSQSSDMTSFHFCRFAWHGPCLIWKRFSDVCEWCCKSKQDVLIVGRVVMLIPDRSIDRVWVRQFSPAVIVNVIALCPSLPWTAEDHPGAWRGPPTCTYAHARGWSMPLVWQRQVSPVTFDSCSVADWSLIMDRRPHNSIARISCCCGSHIIQADSEVITVNSDYTPAVLSVWCSI